MTTAYSYVRFSSRQQASGNSEDRQSEAAQAYAKKHGLHLDESLRDLGKSAFRGKHAKTGALGRFLGSIKEGLVQPGSVLLVENLDRLSRENVYDAQGIFRHILDAGVDIVTLNDGVRYSAEDLRGEWTKIILPMTYMSRAHDESKAKSDRSKDNWKRNREKARAGKIVSGMGPQWLRRKGDVWELIPERVEAVRLAFQLCRSGVGMNSIAKIFNQRGIQTFRGGREWQKASVAKLLNYPAVKGEYQPHVQDDDGIRVPDGEPIQGYYPTIIEPWEFDKVQSILKERAEAYKNRKGGGPAGKEFANIFQKVGVCGSCGAAMRFKRGSAEKGGDRLFCPAHRVEACSNKKTFQYAKVEPAIISSLRYLDLSAVLQNKSGIEDELQRRIGNLEAQVAKEEKRKGRVLNSLAEEDDADVQSDIKGLLKATNEKLKTLRAELTAVQNELREVTSAAETSAGHQSLLAEFYDKQAIAGDEERLLLRTRLNMILRSAVDRLEFTSDGDVIGFYKRPSVAYARRRFPMSDGYDTIGFSLLKNRSPIHLIPKELEAYWDEMDKASEGFEFDYPDFPD